MVISTSRRRNEYWLYYRYMCVSYNWIYPGDIGSQSHKCFKCAAQQNIIRTLHCAPSAPSKDSFCPQFPHFAHLHLVPSPLPLWLSPHLSMCLCLIYICFLIYIEGRARRICWWIVCIESKMISRFLAGIWGKINFHLLRRRNHKSRRVWKT